jgi:hypothetical protein
MTDRITGGGVTGKQRTDIKVDAVAPGHRPEEYDRVTIIIEAKGCWNKRLEKDMEEQLRDRYLTESPCRHGLYLVGWFACTQWEAGDYRKGQTPDMTAARAQRHFDEQAAGLSNGGLRIRAAVLNVALR